MTNRRLILAAPILAVLASTLIATPAVFPAWAQSGKNTFGGLISVPNFNAADKARIKAATDYLQTLSSASGRFERLDAHELARKTLLPGTISCTTSNLTKNDSVQVTFQSGAVGHNKTIALSSTDGTNWSAALPSGTQLSNSGATEQFSFSATRTSSDSATASTA